MGRQLFGTDGIRGVAGEYPLDPATAHAFGAALGRWAGGAAADPEVVIGMDTRESGPWLAGQVAGGLERYGVRTRFAGLITTPGVAYLTRTQSFVAGVMISASHNPYQDNGIKVFDHSGFKLPDEVEHALEDDIFRLRAGDAEPVPRDLLVDEALDETYIDFLASVAGVSLAGLTIVLDCANGAASHLAPELFERLGAHVYSLGCLPNGRNINLNCGALHVESLRGSVVEKGADIGIAFDGDADRAIFVTSTGKIASGDHVLMMCGKDLLRRGKLSSNEGLPLVVATIMSNLGLERALAAAGIRLMRTAVGDKYVLEEMLARGAMLGGEQSGHVIFREHATTGDGLLTALQVLQVLRNSGRSLDELTGELEIYPQVLVNVRVKTKRPLKELSPVNDEIRAAEAEFGEAGRVVVRFSGTEPLARVMVEGPEEKRVQQAAERIANVIRSELGGV